MKRILSLLIAFATLASIAAFLSHTSQRATAQEAAPIYGVKISPEYRDWTLISVACVGGTLNNLCAKLGNDVAIKSYREGKLPFPHGTIIARVAWKQEEDNKAVRPIVERGGKPDGEGFPRPAFPAMNPPKIATLSLPVTQLNGAQK
jgi:Cytochrome P460